MGDDKIKKIEALEILDSRGNPTVQAKITLENGLSAKAGIPSGASTGTHEALELRDGDQSRYGGKGVLKAVANINGPLNDLLKGQTIGNLQEIDRLMLSADGTANKSKFGANAILGVSLAAARLGALVKGESLYQYLRNIYGLNYSDWRLPVPLANIINGGRHADNNLDCQEFWIIPQGIKDYPQALRACAEIFHVLAKELKKKNYSTNVGDEGGYAPQVASADEAWEAMLQAITTAGYRPGQDVWLGMDVGSSEFYDDAKGLYDLKAEGKSFRTPELIEYYKGWLQKYPLAVIEDALAEDDWDGWRALTADSVIKEKQTVLIGDDLFVTNPQRLQRGIDEKVANAILIKLNQIGSVTETIETIKLAQAHGYQIAISHRSGETVDDFIADLAVAVRADFIKTGATSRGERVAKYNRLLEIHQELLNK
jgi:enolase